VTEITDPQVKVTENVPHLDVIREWKMPEPLATVNLEVGSPTVEEARQELKSALERCKNRKATVVKIIHGYGSSGLGGALRHGIRKSLLRRRKEGLVRAVVFGENWNIFDPMSRVLLEQHPSLGKDSDLCRSNPGVSIVLL
jgi:ribosomal protein S9